MSPDEPLYINPQAHSLTELSALVDQHQAMARDLVKDVVDHWEDPDCPGGRMCLGATSHHIVWGMVHNPAAIGNALQGAIGLLATAEYDRRHPEKKGV